ncbi:murein hydrolase activator EnvC family protein [Ulvibacter litoralis]|uniref:Septal ring factor EnvC, activator of murein hydrolases AmiA and AmiB n=1 Tax=Ulvibacter litoralis TaxID=227084 RepID=A0A1G7D814_9FLAO|nr:peptidoglycan DD-metalloendopeptidase family protein [Ulvibacter litoralis]GHC44747.1 peptidase M23 [Ulvibacter litoralis]SDE46905.1 Septal ring factor EnvC, activator of murein hydrolases AmiA and AmiB [Ulvibacter litoralis]
MKKIQLYLFILLSLLTTSIAFSQPNKQKELEERRVAILSEIKQINALLFKTRGQAKSILTQVEDISQRINARENLIKVTNQQANLLTRTINDNLQKMDQLRKELKELKEDYAGMITKSYKSKSEQSRIMFLFSSENFLQAYKRLQYMKQYAKQRKKQGESIKEKAELLKQLNNDLIVQKKKKEVLIKENQAEKAKLKKEKLDQERLVASLKKDEGTFASQIKQKKKEADAIEKQIEDLIRAAIAKSNSENNNNTTTTTTTKSTTFALTPEAKALAANFTSNKGKLIWPVEKGVVTENFGKHQHPQFPNVTTNNNGVDITTEPNAKARAVFKGEVMQVQQIKGANQAIYIRHGDYITIYRNLAKVSVKKGDKVSTKQEIGTIYNNPTTGKTILKFYIYRNDAKMNPADWVYKM